MLPPRGWSRWCSAVIWIVRGQAANDSVEQTLGELGMVSDEQVERAAKSSGKAFKKPMPSALAGPTTLLQALQAGVAEKLAAAGCSARTGAEPSLAQLAGVPASVLAGN